jgi:cell division protein FtsW
VSARTTTVRPATRPSSTTTASRSRHPTASTAARRPPRRKPVRHARRPAPLHAYLLVAVVAVLTLLGLVMVLSASSVTALHLDGSSWTYFKRQAVWMVLGIAAFAMTTVVPYQRWRRFVGPLLTVSFVAMAAVLVPSIGREVNGARAWFAFGPIGFQPAELMKVALLLYAADLLARRADRMHEVRLTFLPLLVVLAAATFLILLQPDLGGAMVLAGIVLGVAFIAGTPLLPFGVTVAGIGAVGGLFMLQVRAERWTAFLDLAAHKQDDGFQVWQSLVGIASGGLTGVGLGAGKAKWGYLPEAHTDFIFAIIAEELGFAGVAIVLSLFLVLVWLGIRIALRAPDRFGTLLAGGITSWILVQTLINVGGVVGLMPLTGLTLPFVSFGGSSLLVTMGAAGLLLNIARAGR